jgi:hypothetical protein
MITLAGSNPCAYPGKPSKIHASGERSAKAIRPPGAVLPTSLLTEIPGRDSFHVEPPRGLGSRRRMFHVEQTPQVMLV